jgi:Regulator of ribonuclease activity B
MPKRAKIGDVYEIATPAGLAYAQYTHDEPDMGELVRVLPGFYAARPDVSALAKQKELYFVFYLLKYALRQGQVQFVSSEPVPDWAKPWPIMRHRCLDNSWFIEEGSKGPSLRDLANKRTVKELTSEQRKLSIGSRLVPHIPMVKRLAQGWLPELDEEFERREAAEAKARKEAEKAAGSEQQAAPKSLEHYLYFPRKSNAEQAAERLRAKGWEVEVKKGADGRNWLASAKQSAPVEDDIEEIRDELERLAEELGGEYDGWGASV